MQVAVAQRAVCAFATVFDFQYCYRSHDPCLPRQVESFDIVSAIRPFVVREAFGEYVVQLNLAHVSVLKHLNAIGVQIQEQGLNWFINIQIIGIIIFIS